MATKTTTPAATTIPVRLNLLVHIDPAKWTPPAPAASDAPAFDQAKTAAALAALYGEDRARQMAAQLAAPAVEADTGPQAVRVAVRAYVLKAVQELEQLTKAGATVVDADRQPKAAAK